MSKILGVWSGHDASCSVLQSGMPVFHTELERHLREKEPQGDSAQLLQDFWKDYSDVEAIATCFSDEKIRRYPESYRWLQSFGKPIHVLSHHLSHAAHGFYCSNYETALIFTLDGGGFEDKHGTTIATAVWAGQDTKISLVEQIPMHSMNIGGVWSRACRYVFDLQNGWPRGSQVGTIMSMAAFGDPMRFVQDFTLMLTRDIIESSAKPHNQPPGARLPGKDPRHSYLDKWALIGERSEQDKFDLAAGLQTATEHLLQAFFQFYLDWYPQYRNIVLSGGVALNSVIAGKIKKWFGDRVDNVYVPPIPYDGGLCLGASQYVWHHVLGHDRIVWSDYPMPYLGQTYTKDDVQAALQAHSEQLRIELVNDFYVIEKIAEGNIISIFQGRAESGRRALGNRSIVADPTRGDMKQIINDKVKLRAWHRPFAPSILRERVPAWFEENVDSPYMSFVAKFKPEQAKLVPAVVHVDGSARLQTVTRENNPWWYSFIETWEDRTGIPILLNTSFNESEPICETPEHALNTFMKTKIDYLYFADWGLLVSKKK